jgi:tyrosine-protein kinase Etk/Wzc
MDTHDKATHEQGQMDHPGFDMMFIARMILSQWRVFLLSLTLGLLLTAGAYFYYPRDFVASTLVLLPQQQNAGNNALAQLGAMAGVSSASVVKSQDEMIMAFMKSRTFMDRLVDRFQLKNRYDKATHEEARIKLAKRLSITSSKKSGMLTIEFADYDGAFAADLANACVDELRAILSKVAITEAQQRKVFLENQVEKLKEGVGNAEKVFRLAQSTKGFTISQALAESSIKASAEVRALIASKEVQLKVSRRFATDINPEVQRLMAEISELKGRLQRLEEGVSEGGHDGKEVNDTAMRAYRDLKIQEAMLDGLIRQLEIARIDEAREGPLLQQVDKAIKPERRSRPTGSVIVGFGIALTLSMSMILAMIMERRLSAMRRTS